MQSDRSNLLKIRKLKVNNFRCFGEHEFELSDEFNVLVGANESGKTAVLDALATGLVPVCRGLGTDPDRHAELAADDVRRVTYPGRSVERQLPARLCWVLQLNRELAQWETSIERSGSPQGNPGRVEAAMLATSTAVGGGEDVVLPVVCYYPAERQTGTMAGGDARKYAPGPRASGYHMCMRPSLREESFLHWFAALEMDSWQVGRTAPGLAAVKAAVTSCIPHCRDVLYRAIEASVVAVLAEGRELPFRMLSHGVKNVLAMVADIAWRSFVLNPHFGEAAPAETPGVVLVDEIDLHLHPTWQRTVVDDLRRTFPRVQFIATTHSPFIIQSLEPGELINLDEREPAEYSDQPIEDIIENVQGVEEPQVSTRRRQMMKAAQRYFEVLEQAEKAPPHEKERLKRELDELSRPFSDNVAYHASLAFMEAKREAAGLGDGES